MGDVDDLIPSVASLGQGELLEDSQEVLLTLAGEISVRLVHQRCLGLARRRRPVGELGSARALGSLWSEQRPASPSATRWSSNNRREFEKTISTREPSANSELVDGIVVALAGLSPPTLDWAACATTPSANSRFDRPQ
jgi:hypothetical protein